MKDPKALQLLQEVSAKTRAGRIHWEPTALEAEYFSVLPSGRSISVAEFGVGANPINRTYALTLSEGPQELLRATSDTDGATFMELVELHELARQQALGVDRAIDQVLGELAKL